MPITLSSTVKNSNKKTKINKTIEAIEVIFAALNKLAKLNSTFSKFLTTRNEIKFIIVPKIPQRSNVANKDTSNKTAWTSLAPSSPGIEVSKKKWMFNKKSKAYNITRKIRG